MMKNKRVPWQVIPVAAAALLLAAGALFWSLRKPASPAGAADGKAGAAAGGPAAVKLYRVETSSFTDVVGGLVGTIKGDTIELAYGGADEQLIGVHVRVGQAVRRGDLLFELDHARAEARKSQAEVAYQRMVQLRDAGGATAQDVKEAKAAYDISRKDYEDTYVRAPKAGAMSDVNRQTGETVTRNEVLGVLVSNEDKLVMETGVVEGQLDKVERGQKAVVEIDALGGAPVEGTVLGVSREVTTTGRTGTVHIILPDAVQKQLRPGLSARARIVTYDKKTLAIPFQSFDVQNRQVFRLDGAGAVHAVKVELGHVTHDFYEVASGLSEGDRVVKDLAATPVKDGDSVAPDGEDDTYQKMAQGAPGSPQ